jgi:hypothetical protein
VTGWYLRPALPAPVLVLVLVGVVVVSILTKPIN